jgi:outer membrane receptor for ferrienterochelin and colicins
MKVLEYLLLSLLLTFIAAAQVALKGFIGEKDEKVNERPLAGVNVYWLGTTKGTTTDTNGFFILPFVKQSDTVVIRCIGYYPDTIEVRGRQSLHIILRADVKNLGEVEIVGQQQSTYLQYSNPLKTTVITERELFKAACCNLSESFQTNPSIDVSYTDAITGTKQIEMLGLSGIYTQTTLENMPYIRGLTSNAGLTFIPGSWIEAINLSKGLGSVANGYESITGQIDVDLRKPEKEDEQNFFINLYGNQDQRMEANLNMREPLSERISSMTLLHYSTQHLAVDENGDRFLDMPLFTTYNFLQRWNYSGTGGLTSQLGVQYVSDKKEGGSVVKSSPSAYRYDTDSGLLRLHGKTGYVFSQDQGRSIGIQWSLSRYRNTSLFGLRNYNGEEQNGYLNILYQAPIADGAHKFRTGVSYMYDEFNEMFVLNRYRRIERVPGMFFEYTFTPNEKLTMIAGLRADEHNAYGNMLTPRLHLRYTPQEDWVFRAAAGRGYRTANIFAENSAVFASSRNISIIPEGSFGYGLKQEIAWNYGVNITHYFLINDREATLMADLYRTQFEQVVLADLDSNPHEVKFYSAPDGSYSNSFQAELDIQPLERLDTRIAYRYLDVEQRLGGVWRERPLTAQHRVLATLSYSTEREQPDDPQTSFDMTLQWSGRKRIPDTSLNPESLRALPFSPDFFTFNFQASRTFVKGLDIYIGVENLFGFRQNDPILDGANPVGHFFDASLIWGPLSGRMVYAGLRLRV